MIRRLYDDPRLVILVLTMIAVSGMAGFSTRMTREDPVSKVRWGYVSTRLPGAEPVEVESLVSEPLERILREAGAIRSIESASLQGVSLVFIRLTDEVKDVEQAWLRIQDKVAQAADKLPRRASVPLLVDEARWGAHTRIVALHGDSDRPVPPGILARWGKELNNRLSFVPGTRFTEVFGVPVEEVLVEIDESEIAAAKLPAAEIANRIRARDSEGFDAMSQSDRYTLPVSSSGDLIDLDSVRQIVVSSDGAGRQLTLGDLADVSRSERFPRSESAFVKGRRAVVVATRMDEAYGISGWTFSQQEALSDFQAILPQGLEITAIFDQQSYTDQRAADLYQSLGIGLALVVVVVCLMMGWRAAIPICAALPMTLGVVFLLMIPFGISLHQMSIAGLILAIGMLIDNPIIVVDDLQRRLNHGDVARDACRGSVRHLTTPLLGSNITTILGFTPILLIGGPTGEFMEQLGWSVIASLIASLTLSLTIVPVLAAWCLVPAGDVRDVSRRHPSQLYMALLRFGMHRPLAVILLTVIVPGFGLLAARSIPEQFFPAAERDQFHFSVRLPTHVSIAETERIAKRARDIVMRHSTVEEVALFVGRSAPKLHYSMVGLEDNRSNFAQGLVQLTSESVPLDLVHDIQRDLDQELPEAQCVVTLIEQGPPAPAPIELRLYGSSLQELSDLGRQAQTLLMEVPGIIHTRMSLDAGGPHLALAISQTEAEPLGLDDERISGQIRDYLDGIVVAEMTEQMESIPIRVRLSGAEQLRPERVLTLPIVTETTPRRATTVDSLATWTIDEQTFSIYRRNARRCNIVYAYTQAGTLPIQIENAFKEEMRQSGFSVPAGYRFDFGGISYERDSAVGHLLAYSAIVLVLMASVLVLTFGSFRLAFIILLVATLAVGLGMFCLWAFRYPIGIVAIIGVAGLLGLAVNDSIVILSECKAGAAHYRTIPQSVFSATRHVLTTSVTTVAGVLPLILRGGDFWPPMMIVIAGGIVGATVVALGFTPACYLLLGGDRSTTV
ncbi:Cobalt-zinc-cadmium resistance protein CzcA [Stieleria maiorica]|uniref:Cobalt-zinc-cadmium resistance protein CzcA n=1 Tax=Stieleria maiorica TaxID=2795974 RepID=A0A5B9MI07_9BACT|nr:efflux RND transporter permease subunit [Stieleria maiorica]QEF99676.1 Cobalt-zinc-cadmium resistance protein CzcA [Stieleria maiorica]